MSGGEPTSDELIFRWWSETHDERPDMVTPEMRVAYTREVVYPERLARFDAYLAERLQASEWAYVTSRLRDRGTPPYPSR